MHIIYIYTVIYVYAVAGSSCTRKKKLMMNIMKLETALSIIILK